MKSFSLKDKTALVTGGGTGLGRAIATTFAAFGANVLVHYNASAKAADEVVAAARTAGVAARSVQADLTREGHVAELAAAAEEFGRGGLDILVNNAGNIYDSAPSLQMPLELWEKTMRVNLDTVFMVCKHVAPLLQRRPVGRIINMSSVAAHNGGGPGTAPYAASKAAIKAFSKSLAKELAPDVLVNCIAPGVIATRIHDAYTTPEARARGLSRIPLGREGRPDEIAGAALLLASDFGSYITGETIEINGGLLMD